MTDAFKYSVLKYVHSQFLGEELNIGIVLLFPKQNKLVFRHPKKIGKFKSVYRAFHQTAILKYLQSFEDEASRLSNTELGDNLDNILSRCFLIKESAPLQFTESKSALQYTDDWEKITDQYFRLYFPEEFPLEIADLAAKSVKHRTDKQLVSAFRKILQQKERNINRYLKPSVEIKTDLAHFKADLVWQNHTTNAVKAVSLDLGTDEVITDKALLFNAKLNYLSDEASSKNIRFDLIVAAPQQEDLRKAYDSALHILNDIKAPKEIITEDQLEKYALRTLSELER